jgi:predicted transposase YdaD
MPQQFDATLKELVQAHPADWVAFIGGSVAGPIEVLTPDLSTVSAFADVVLRVPGGVLHLDFQSGPDPDVSSRMLLYNVLAYRHFDEPVLTVLVLLRPKADRSDLPVRSATNCGRAEAAWSSIFRWCASGKCRWRRCSRAAWA